VLLERLCERAATIPEAESSGAAELLAGLEHERAAAHARLAQALASPRYVALLDLLVAAANGPALAPAADTAAADVVPGLVRRPWHKLEKRVQRLDASPSDKDLHEIRIRTKRVRYAADASAPVVGKQARALARAAAGLQQVLGDLNDAVVAAAWLDEQRSRADAGAARAAQAMAASERADAASLRAQWRTAWEALAAPELRAWM